MSERVFDPERDCSMCGEDKQGFEHCQNPKCEESEDYVDPDSEEEDAE